MTVPEDILRRARGLSETAKRGGSENEMTQAAEALSRLLGRYNITELDLNRSTDTVCIVKNVNGKYNETWRKTCFGAAAELYYCDYFYKAINGRTVGVIHCVIGEPHNVEVAAEIGGFFEATINRLANEASRHHKEITSEHTSRHRFIRSFRLGASERLMIRVQQYVNKAKAGQLTDESGSFMPAILTLYERQEQLFAVFLQKNGIAITERENRDQYLSALGAALGTKAGDSISFTTQLSPKGSSKFALPGS